MKVSIKQTIQWNIMGILDSNNNKMNNWNNENVWNKN